MNAHRSTSLRYFVKHCPKALAFYEAGEPIDREIFQVGIAAHATLQAMGEEANRLERTLTDGECEVVGFRTSRSIALNGRSFDGEPEPPMCIDHAVEGRDLAIEWARWNPVEPGGQQEVGLAMDAQGNACAYDDPKARYRAILDELRPQEVGDEEYAGSAAVLTEWKTAWPTDESELDTVQTRGQAVLVGLKHPGEFDLIIRRVVNLRTRQTFEHILSPEEDRPLLEKWKRDILLLCEAADVSREARPGAGCGGCPWAHSCPDALAAVKDAEDVALQFTVAQAVRDDLFDLAKLVCKDNPQPVPGGALGYHPQERRKPHASAARDIALEWFNVLPEDVDQWSADNARLLGLLQSLDIGTSQVKAAAKALHPERGSKDVREALIESLTEPVVQRQFGVRKVDQAQEAA